MTETKTKSFSLEETKTIIEVILEFVNTCDDKLTTIGLDDLSGNPAMCIGTMQGGGKGQENVIGGYTADFPFILYLKKNNVDTAGRINAIEELTKIGSFFSDKTSKKELPFLGDRDISLKIEMTTYPYLSDKDDNNNELYQAMCNLRFKHKSIYE